MTQPADRDFVIVLGELLTTGDRPGTAARAREAARACLSAPRATLADPAAWVDRLSAPGPDGLIAMSELAMDPAQAEGLAWALATDGSDPALAALVAGLARNSVAAAVLATMDGPLASAIWTQLAQAASHRGPGAEAPACLPAWPASLIAGVHHPSGAIRARAAELAWWCAAVIPVQSELIAMVRGDADPAARASALEAISLLDDSESHAALADALGESLVTVARAAAWSCPQRESAFDLALRGLDDPRPEVSTTVLGQVAVRLLGVPWHRFAQVTDDPAYRKDLERRARRALSTS